MKDAAAWIETYKIFWEAQFDSLANYLQTGQSTSSELESPKPKPAVQKKRRNQHGHTTK